jgi:hypothetical protein
MLGSEALSIFPFDHLGNTRSCPHISPKTMGFRTLVQQGGYLLQLLVAQPGFRPTAFAALESGDTLALSFLYPLAYRTWCYS